MKNESPDGIERVQILPSSRCVSVSWLMDSSLRLQLDHFHSFKTEGPTFYEYYRIRLSLGEEEFSSQERKIRRRHHRLGFFPYISGGRNDGKGRMMMTRQKVHSLESLIIDSDTHSLRLPLPHVTLLVSSSLTTMEERWRMKDERILLMIMRRALTKWREAIGKSLPTTKRRKNKGDDVDDEGWRRWKRKGFWWQSARFIESVRLANSYVRGITHHRNMRFTRSSHPISPCRARRPEGRKATTEQSRTSQCTLFYFSFSPSTAFEILKLDSLFIESWFPSRHHGRGKELTLNLGVDKEEGGMGEIRSLDKERNHHYASIGTPLIPQNPNAIEQREGKGMEKSDTRNRRMRTTEKGKIMMVPFPCTCCTALSWFYTIILYRLFTRNPFSGMGWEHPSRGEKAFSWYSTTHTGKTHDKKYVEGEKGLMTTKGKWGRWGDRKKLDRIQWITPEEERKRRRDGNMTWIFDSLTEHSMSLEKRETRGT